MINMIKKNRYKIENFNINAEFVKRIKWNSTTKKMQQQKLGIKYYEL